MTKPQLPRRRVFKPKVRSGCMQCKRAKFKCPEQKPVCARCQRLAIECCYVPPKPKQNDVAQRQSKIKAMRQILPATAMAIGLLQPSPQPSWCDLEPGGGMYLDCFRGQVALMNQDVEMTDFWLRTALRASHRDESITYAIVAIGALARSRMKASTPTSFGNPYLSDQETRAHYCAAIKYYNRAIATFRSYLTSCSKPENAHRTILIITVLFVVFEILHGNSRAADTLTATGILLLKDKILHSVNKTARSSLAGFIDDQGILEAELFLTRSATLCSKASYLMPYANADGLKAMLMIPSYGLNVPAPPDEDADIKTLCFQFLQVLTPILVWHARVRASRVMGNSMYDPVFLQQQFLLLRQLRGWIEAYQRQLEKKHAAHISDHLEWQSILAKLGYVIVYCELDPTGDLWDSMGVYCSQLIPKFRARLEAESIRQSKLGGSLISLEVSFMWGIFVAAAVNVATECRDQSVRLALIDLCKLATDNNSFLGHLRGTVVATALFIEAEEEGRDKAGKIPQSSRYQLETATWDENLAQVRLRIIAKVADQDGNRKKNELICHLKDPGFA